MTNRYTVIGNPVAHSKSPWIHARFAEQCDIELAYDLTLAPIGGLAAALEAFRAEGGRGANVTVPFKQDAYELCTELSERARLAAAVNTLTLDGDGVTIGDNTDGFGLCFDLTQAGVTLAGSRILMLGAGGAVRGTLGPLLDASPTRLHIANRTAARATVLADEFTAIGNVTGGGCDQLTDERWDLVINGTAASLQGSLPDIPAAALKGALCYDMMYGAEPTPFLTWALASGAAATRDGLGMLVAQAAESFRIWHGVMPEADEVMVALRALLGKS